MLSGRVDESGRILRHVRVSSRMEGPAALCHPEPVEGSLRAMHEDFHEGLRDTMRRMLPDDRL
jgi:hypothetical protein